MGIILIDITDGDPGKYTKQAEIKWMLRHNFALKSESFIIFW